MSDTQHNPLTLAPLAKAVSENAHSPYSGIRVGAVVVDAAGRTHVGCNVESASYGLTQCAERNALAAAVAAGAEPGSLQALVVYSSGFRALSPCGGCRQLMSELLRHDARVYSCSEDAEARSWDMSQLLPDPFVLG